MAEKLTSYRDLKVWQNAMTLAETCYLQTKPFPREEIFGLTSQIRRAAASIAANIAEGYGREQTGAFQFLRLSRGSLKELETHLILAQHRHIAARKSRFNARTVSGTRKDAPRLHPQPAAAPAQPVITSLLTIPHSPLTN